jgi:hypothetical protein
MHSSERNKANAYNNMLTKISLLERLNEDLKNGDGLDLEHVPKTIRQFNQWHSKQALTDSTPASPVFSKNANDTLRKNPVLRQRAQNLIAEIQHKLLLNKKKNKNPLSIQLNHAKNYISILEHQLTLQQTLILETSTQNRQEQLRLNNIITELRKKLSNGR